MGDAEHTPMGLIQAGVGAAILVVLSSAIEDTAHVDEQLAVGEGAMPAHLVQVIEPLITEQVGKHCRNGGGGGLLGESRSIRSSVFEALRGERLGEALESAAGDAESPAFTNFARNAVRVAVRRACGPSSTQVEDGEKKREAAAAAPSTTHVAGVKKQTTQR